MAALFNTIVNMSITGSIVIAAVIIIRFIIKRLPKKYSYLLWSVVAFRLCIPVSIESVISLFQFGLFPANPNNIAADSGVIPYVPMPESVDSPPQISQQVQNTADVFAVTDVQSKVTVTDILPYVWLAGALLFILYGIISYIRLSKRLSSSIKYIDNIYQSDCISSPFIFGIIKPKIYIPFNIKSEYFGYVISHEKYHIKRLDYIVKPFAFLVLSVHWFNPICYLAFYLMSKDMEMSCDERVLGNSIDTKKNYSYALLSFAADKKFPSPGPLCFGEGSAESRIKNVLRFKKPNTVVSVIAMLLCGFVLVSCAANPKTESKSSVSNSDINISADYKAYAIGDRIGMTGSLSAIIELNGYAYISDKDLFINLQGSNEYFNDIYKSGSAIEVEITENELKQIFENNGIVFDNELPDFKNGKVIHYYDAVHSSTPSYSVYVFDDVPYMLEYIQRYFLLSFDEEENKKLSDGNYLSSLLTLNDSQREYIDRLFNTLENPDNPLTPASSNPSDYINYNEEIYETLVSGRFFTMQYIFGEFSKGNQTGLKGHLMRDVMNQIIGGEVIKLAAETGQEYFDAWAESAVRIFSHSSAEDVEIMKSTMPYSYWYFTNYYTTNGEIIESDNNSAD